MPKLCLRVFVLKYKRPKLFSCVNQSLNNLQWGRSPHPTPTEIDVKAFNEHIHAQIWGACMPQSLSHSYVSSISISIYEIVVHFYLLNYDDVTLF